MYNAVDLYEHNLNSYQKIRQAYDDGEKIVGIVHATGTGKSYNALQLAYDEKDKKIVYVVPSVGIIDHIKKIIMNNPNLDLERDFSNLEFRTYQSFVSLSREQIKNIDCDLLILDEFHHMGAPIWGNRINMLVDTHSNMKVFGMTAYTVRDRGTEYERDMANEEDDELFSNKIVSKYDLCDAMIDKILPKPIYRSAYINLEEELSELEQRIDRLSANRQVELKKLLKDAVKRVHEAPGIADVLKKNIKPNGKYIYFCPPNSVDGVNDIETIKKQAMEWFKTFVPEKDIVFYTSTKEMGEEGKENRDNFYNDMSMTGEDTGDKLRVMFAINQYNEGIHAPNIDGVIMGRGTTSDIIFFEQLGRALSVRGNTKDEYKKLKNKSREELVLLCKERDILIRKELSKDEIIETLLAPVVIDLAGNYDFIKELENNLKDRVKEVQEKGDGHKRVIKIADVSFDIDIENQDLFNTLRAVFERLSISWEEMYGYAKKYYEHYGNLEVPYKFKTSNGYDYDENGEINLGKWITNQRSKENPETERGKKLAEIGLSFEKRRRFLDWEKMYEYAKKYYERHGDLKVPQKFKTNNGYDYDENGKIRLGEWIARQRQKETPETERGKKLAEIGFRFGKLNISWEEMYEYAKKYYERHGNLEVPRKFKTSNGYDYDENGEINLGNWIANQRQSETPETERGQKLAKIGFRFETRKKNNLSWEEMYEYAKKYSEHHGNLKVLYHFKTNNGYDYDENGKIRLGEWIAYQRKKENLETERGQKLAEIGFRFDKGNIPWEEVYEYAKKYYEYHGNLEVPQKFKTNNGYEYDENGKIKLGEWIAKQRQKETPKTERGKKLVEIGFRFGTKKKRKEEIDNICVEYSIDLKINSNIIKHISVQELYSKINFLLDNEVSIVDNDGKLHEIFTMSNINMQAKYNVSLEKLIDKYYYNKLIKKE